MCKLKKALYGLKQSPPRLWYEFLSKILKAIGFVTLPYDQGAFVHPTKGVVILCHVDDFLALGENEAILNSVLEEVSLKVKLQALGEVSTFLGIEFSLEKHERTGLNNKSIKGYKSLRLHQAKYVKSMLKRFGKENLIPVSTPVQEGVKLQKATSEPSKEDLNLYQQQVGSLLFLSTKTRPDISFAVNNCARYMSKPDKSHFKALDRIWAYLIKYPDLGLYISDNENIGLLGFSDSDWANCLMNRRSTTGYCFLFNRNIISWNSTLQHTVAISSCEAEYIALKEACKEAIFLSGMLKWLEDRLENKLINNKPLGEVSLPSKTVPILTDSQSAIKLGENPEFHKRSKHIDITYHFIRECISEEKVKLVFVRTTEQLADGLTKGLNKTKHNAFIEGLNLLRP